MEHSTELDMRSWGDQSSKVGRIACMTFVAPAKAGVQLLALSWPTDFPESNDLRIQIPPLRIDRFYQSNLPCSPPFLDRLLPGDCGRHVAVLFVPDEIMHAVASGEALDEVVPVLPDAHDQVGRDADVKGAVVVAGEEVDAGLLHVPKHESWA